MSEPRIDVIVIRDPDYETVTEIYIDGKPAPIHCTHVWSFDPGAGYTYAEYREDLGSFNRVVAPTYVRDRLVEIHKELLPSYRRWAVGDDEWPKG